MSFNQLQNSSDNDNTCVVCFKNVEIYSVGACDHPVCFECSTRMRVLCRQKECPICRQDLPKVIFTRKVESFVVLKSKYERIHYEDYTYGIVFGSASIQAAYYELLQHDCPICSKPNRCFSFKTFQQLKDHMRRDHELYYCDLCVANLKIFTFERKCYNRTELAQHRRKGDVDNTSHRGHPLCEFCDQRYMDNDELYRHLRRDHLFCHFCDTDGKHQYYNSYADLRNHFHEEHYLCEEGDCKNQPFIAAFRTEIDFKAHVASVHGKNWSRSANKQARTLELEFTLAPRNRSDQNGGRMGRKQFDKRNQDQECGAVYDNQYQEPGGGDGEVFENSKSFVNPLSSNDFPSLGNDSQIPRTTSSVTFTSKITPSTFNEQNFPALSSSTSTKASGGVTITGKVNAFQAKDFSNIGACSRAPEVTITRTIRSSQQGLKKTDENFPALGESSLGSTVRLSVNSGNLQDHKQRPNVSIHVNHKSNGTITTGKVEVRPKTEPFPALSSAPVPEAQWVIQKPKKQEQKSIKKVAPSPDLPPSSLNDFPALSKSAKNDKTKKSSSFLVNLNSYNNAARNSKENPSNVQCEAKKLNCNNNSKQKHQENVPNKHSNKSTKIGLHGSKSADTSKIADGDRSSCNKVDAGSFKCTKTSNSAETNDSKSKSKKKKNKNENNNMTSSESNADTINNQNVNGVLKKRSELKIEPLEVLLNDDVEKDFPTLCKNKPPPPPGFNIKPPPGLNNFNAIASSNKRTSTSANINLKTSTLSSPNDLTFTTSSGQCYSILPQYHRPPNFQTRNKNLIENFMTILKGSDSIKEFKNYSDLFRNGTYPAEKYYEHCENVLGNEFNKVFPELLVLLPDIDKQQELYEIHAIKNANNNNNKNNLDMCQTCKQVVLTKDLRSHLSNHNLESHFPVLSQPNNANNVWKRP